MVKFAPSANPVSVAVNGGSEPKVRVSTSVHWGWLIGRTFQPTAQSSKRSTYMNCAAAADIVGGLGPCRIAGMRIKLACNTPHSRFRERRHTVRQEFNVL